MKRLILSSALLYSLSWPGMAQLPQNQDQYWRQVDEQMRQQEQERWARDITEQSWRAQEAMNEPDYYPEPEPPPREPMSTFFLQAGAMAKQSLQDLRDPKLQQFQKGFWDFHSVGEQYRSAMFTNTQGMISVHGPGGGYSGALLLLWGPDVPAPAKLSVVPVTLRQNDEPPQSLKTFNLGFPSVPGWGTLIFVVPSGSALVDNMEDVMRFTATMGGNVVFSSAWHDGKMARAKVSEAQTSPR